MTAGVPAFLPPDDIPFASAAAVIRRVQKQEHDWFKQGDPTSPTLPWMPFSPADFMAFMFEAVPEMRGRRFLDVGCGPGTKMLLARQFFGLQVSGIEINPDMAKAATDYGAVICGDALNVPAGAYREHDLIWLYRPFRDPELEAALERRIMDEMKPGAILAGGQWEHDLAKMRWNPVYDDWDLNRGAYQKPRPVSNLAI